MKAGQLMKDFLGQLLPFVMAAAAASGLDGLERVAAVYAWFVVAVGIVFCLCAFLLGRHESMEPVRVGAIKATRPARCWISVVAFVALVVLLAYQGFLVTAVAYCVTGTFVRLANKSLADIQREREAESV